jgi:GMP synthase (glutamine-hydrolysing)
VSKNPNHDADVSSKAPPAKLPRSEVAPAEIPRAEVPPAEVPPAEVPRPERVAVVLRHEDSAHLGNLDPTLREAGYSPVIIDLHHDQFPGVGEFRGMAQPDLLVILGASAGVYETATHSFIEPELDYVADRLNRKLPTLGICFGAQLMAAALGGTVAPGTSVQVGYRDVVPTTVGANSPIRHFANVKVAQWHGDTFSLPPSATRLAGSRDYDNEAFGIDNWAIAVQFHPELTAEMHEDWLVSEPEYVAGTGQSDAQLRADRDLHSDAMQTASRDFLRDWLGNLSE